MVEEFLEHSYPKEVVLNDGTKVQLRPLRQEDQASLLQFFRDLPQEDLNYLKDDVTDALVIETWCRELNYDRVLPLIGEYDGKIIADATLHQEPRGWMSHIGRVRVAVHPAYRGRGMARTLIQELIQIGGNVGLEKLLAEIIAEQKDAIEAFVHYGFVKVAEFPDHVKDHKGETHDLVIMVNNIREQDYFQID